MSFRNTKIVATLGPASSSPGIVRSMVEAGMNVARLNFSHGTHQQHHDNIQVLRKVSLETGKPLAILQDLGGPKLRIGEVSPGSVRLEPGSEVSLSVRAEDGKTDQLPIPCCPWLPREVKEGQRILLDDGSIQVRVKHIETDEVICSVVVGGSVSSHKGVNLPDT